MQNDTIIFDQVKLIQLKTEYKKAVNDKQQSFVFDNRHELDVNYTKYLIEYLEMVGFTTHL